MILNGSSRLVDFAEMNSCRPSAFDLILHLHLIGVTDGLEENEVEKTLSFRCSFIFLSELISFRVVRV